jgi:hypothetical protein
MNKHRLAMIPDEMGLIGRSEADVSESVRKSGLQSRRLWRGRATLSAS